MTTNDAPKQGGGGRRRPRRSRRGRKKRSEAKAAPAQGAGAAPDRPRRRSSRRRRRIRPETRVEATDGRAHIAVAAEGTPEERLGDVSSRGAVPEVTPESLVRWGPPPWTPDPDGEDVLPAWPDEGLEASAAGQAESADAAAEQGPGEAPAPDAAPDGEPAPVASAAPSEALSDEALAEAAAVGVAEPSAGRLVNVGRVRLSGQTRLVDYDAGELTLRRGDAVVVQSDRGQAVGRVVDESVRMLLAEAPARRILRRLNEEDRRLLVHNEERARQALPVAKARAKERRLPMKLSRVEYAHGSSRATFYFSAEGRVDFRGLVKDLAQQFRLRIEMRQIGVRDEAKMIGGLGVCGLRLCCHRYLTKFEPVSIRMAKDQNLVLNPQKVSGQCGRLKCCLAYEEAAYREQRKGLPKLGKRVVSPDGPGRVVELDVLRRRVRVQLESGSSAVYEAEAITAGVPAQGGGERRAEPPRAAREPRGGRQGQTGSPAARPEDPRAEPPDGKRDSVRGDGRRRRARPSEPDGDVGAGAGAGRRAPGPGPTPGKRRNAEAAEGKEKRGRSGRRRRRGRGRRRSGGGQGSTGGGKPSGGAA